MLRREPALSLRRAPLPPELPAQGGGGSAPPNGSGPAEPSATSLKFCPAPAVPQPDKNFGIPPACGIEVTNDPGESRKVLARLFYPPPALPRPRPKKKVLIAVKFPSTWIIYFDCCVLIKSKLIYVSDVYITRFNYV